MARLTRGRSRPSHFKYYKMLIRRTSKNSVIEVSASLLKLVIRLGRQITLDCAAALDMVFLPSASEDEDGGLFRRRTPRGVLL